jgi:hypothetical protein
VNRAGRRGQRQDERQGADGSEDRRGQLLTRRALGFDRRDPASSPQSEVRERRERKADARQRRSRVDGKKHDGGRGQHRGGTDQVHQAA